MSDVCSDCERQVLTSRRVEASFPVTTTIVVINVLVFVAMMLSGASLSGGTAVQLIRWGANYGPLTLAGEWWRLLTSTFVHIGIVHLGINMWCLWNLGRLAELHLGRVQFALVYIASGVFASLASLLWHPQILSAGASGAVFGIAGALISALRLGAVSLGRDEIKQQLNSLLPFCVYNLIIGAVVPGIDNAAHIGGLIAGLVLGAFLAMLSRQRQQGR